MVFRAPCLLPWKTALGNVLLAVDRKYPSEPRARRRARAEEMLVRVGLGDALDRRPGELSAGMRQRVGLARAFVLGPKLLLLDEPFGMLDSLSRFELQEAFLELWARVLEFLEAGGDAPPPLRVPTEKALEEAL
jgi:ABC-type nitrate/sulfonate/bicarbonate transport system ATPase subunit